MALHTVDAPGVPGGGSGGDSDSDSDSDSHARYDDAWFALHSDSDSHALYDDAWFALHSANDLMASLQLHAPSLAQQVPSKLSRCVCLQKNPVWGYSWSLYSITVKCGGRMRLVGMCCPV